MEKKLCLDISQTKGFYDEKLYKEVSDEIIKAHEYLKTKIAGKVFLFIYKILVLNC